MSNNPKAARRKREMVDKAGMITFFGKKTNDDLPLAYLTSRSGGKPSVANEQEMMVLHTLN